ncbi:MAG TPA: enoyl-CoA hydratase/isomerase family protein [Phycisphaerales bacterium]|nr:enoyl-CoA hydratase/isomerase family protein [Phycisphaerales bacterium]
MIRVERRDAIAAVVLARPERRNALTPEMLSELARAITQLGASAGCVLLCGQGPTFCSGFDLAACRDSPDGSAMRELLVGLDSAVRALRSCPAPVVVACQGGAIAGGCALVAGGDFAVADRAAKLGYPVVRLGISPAVSGPTLLPRIGPGAARVRMLDPGLIDAAEALRLGLISSVVETPEEVGPAAERLAIELAAKPRAGMVATKRWLNELDGTAAADRRALEVSLGLAGGPEEAELLGAFWARRAT